VQQIYELSGIDRVHREHPRPVAVRIRAARGAERVSGGRAAALDGAPGSAPGVIRAAVELLREAKSFGYSDVQLAGIWGHGTGARRRFARGTGLPRRTGWSTRARPSSRPRRRTTTAPRPPVQSYKVDKVTKAPATVVSPDSRPLSLVTLSLCDSSACRRRSVSSSSAVGRTGSGRDEFDYSASTPDGRARAGP